MNYNSFYRKNDELSMVFYIPIIFWMSTIWRTAADWGSEIHKETSTWPEKFR